MALAATNVADAAIAQTVAPVERLNLVEGDKAKFKRSLKGGEGFELRLATNSASKIFHQVCAKIGQRKSYCTPHNAMQPASHATYRYVATGPEDVELSFRSTKMNRRPFTLSLTHIPWRDRSVALTTLRRLDGIAARISKPVGGVRVHGAQTLLVGADRIALRSEYEHGETILSEIDVAADGEMYRIRDGRPGNALMLSPNGTALELYSPGKRHTVEVVAGRMRDFIEPIRTDAAGLTVAWSYEEKFRDLLTPQQRASLLQNGPARIAAVKAERLAEAQYKAKLAGETFGRFEALAGHSWLSGEGTSRQLQRYTVTMPGREISAYWEVAGHSGGSSVLRRNEAAGVVDVVANGTVAGHYKPSADAILVYVAPGYRSQLLSQTDDEMTWRHSAQVNGVWTDRGTVVMRRADETELALFAADSAAQRAEMAAVAAAEAARRQFARAQREAEDEARRQNFMNMLASGAFSAPATGDAYYEHNKAMMDSRQQAIDTAVAQGQATYQQRQAQVAQQQPQYSPPAAGQRQTPAVAAANAEAVRLRQAADAARAGAAAARATASAGAAAKPAAAAMCQISPASRTSKHPDPFPSAITEADAMAYFQRSAANCQSGLTGTVTNFQCKVRRDMGLDLRQCEATVSCPGRAVPCGSSASQQ